MLYVLKAVAGVVRGVIPPAVYLDLCCMGAVFMTGKAFVVDDAVVVIHLHLIMVGNGLNVNKLSLSLSLFLSMPMA